MNIALLHEGNQIQRKLIDQISLITDRIGWLTFTSPHELLRATGSVVIDVILFKTSAIDERQLQAIKMIKEQFTGTEVILWIDQIEDTQVFNSLKAGVGGFIVGGVSAIKVWTTIEEVHLGGAPMPLIIRRMLVNFFRQQDHAQLSQREQEVLSELCRGKSYKATATSLFISPDTVRSHIRNIYKKLKVHSKAAAVARALKENLV